MTESIKETLAAHRDPEDPELLKILLEVSDKLDELLRRDDAKRVKPRRGLS